MATTRMACAPNVMQQERKLLDALQATRSYRFDGAVLTLRDVSGAELIGWRGADRARSPVPRQTMTQVVFGR